MIKDYFEIIKSLSGKIVKDSREVEQGDVYLAINGDNFDGHSFVADVLNKGASYAIVDRKIPEVDENKLIIVDDTLKALEEIAIYVRNNCKAKFIGITGSNGKTSTKELLKAGLEVQGKTWATAGNLNNNIGMPLTLANAPMDSEFVILEMGMNHTGELLELTKIARPDFVIITNIGRAHHEFFPTTMDIAKAKAEIFTGMDENSIAIVNNGEFFNFLKAEANKHTKNVFSFGETGDIKLLDYDDGKIKANLFSEEINYSLQIKGKHQAMNSLAVLGVIKLLNQNVKVACDALANMAPPKGRGEKTIIKNNQGQFTLIDDAYNASPDSMIASIRTIESYGKGRKIAIIGEMRELGDESVRLHQELLPEILQANIEKVYCCCGNMKALFDILPDDKKGGWAETSLDLWDIVKNEIKPEDIILVKGSLGSKMLLIVDNIKKMKED